MSRTSQFEEHLDQVPRRTNECWLGDMRSAEGVWVCGHKFVVALNGTALAIWKLLDGRRTVREIASHLTDIYDGTVPEAVLEDVVDFVRQLEALGLAAWRSRPLFQEVSLDARP